MLPLAWLAIVTLTAGWMKILSDDPKLGFLAHARTIESAISSGTLPAAIKSASDAHRMIFNDRLDAAVAAFFMVSVVVILLESVREWTRIFTGRKAPVTSEVPFMNAPAVAIDSASAG
jgi:carbon starvation protein